MEEKMPNILNGRPMDRWSGGLVGFFFFSLLFPFMSNKFIPHLLSNRSRGPPAQVRHYNWYEAISDRGWGKSALHRAFKDCKITNGKLLPGTLCEPSGILSEFAVNYTVITV